MTRDLTWAVGSRGTAFTVGGGGPVTPLPSEGPLSPRPCYGMTPCQAPSSRSMAEEHAGGRQEREGLLRRLISLLYAGLSRQDAGHRIDLIRRELPRSLCARSGHVAVAQWVGRGFSTRCPSTLLPPAGRARSLSASDAVAHTAPSPSCGGDGGQG